jgi:hypothetical protein
MAASPLSGLLSKANAKGSRTAPQSKGSGANSRVSLSKPSASTAVPSRLHQLESGDTNKSSECKSMRVKLVVREQLMAKRRSCKRADKHLGLASIPKSREDFCAAKRSALNSGGATGRAFTGGCPSQQLFAFDLARTFVRSRWAKPTASSHFRPASGRSAGECDLHCKRERRRCEVLGEGLEGVTISGVNRSREG